MAHLVNPISFRLNHVRYWNNIWCTVHTFNYSYLNMQDYYIYTYINSLFFTHKYLLGEVLLENIKSIRINSTLNVYIYIRDQAFCSFLFEECEWFYFYDSVNTPASLKKLFNTENPSEHYNQKKKILLRKNYRSFFLQNFSRNYITYKSFRNLGYLINIYKFKYLFDSLTYFYKNSYTCIYYNKICKLKVKTPSGFYRNSKFIKLKTVPTTGYNINFKMPVRHLIVNKLFVIFLAFLLYKYIYFFFKVLLKKNFKKLIKNTYSDINFYFAFYWLSYFSAAFLGRYIKHKLLLNYPVGNILYKILFLLTKAKKKTYL